MLIACVYCSHGAIPIGAGDHAVACPECRRSYRLLTGQVEQSRSERLESGQYRYRLNLIDAGGERRPRTLIAQGGLPLARGKTVTIAYRGVRATGIADQDHGYWFLLEPERPRHPKLWAFAAYMSWVCVALVALQIIRLLDQARGLSSGAFLAAGLIAALALTIPFAIRAASGKLSSAHAPPPSFSTSLPAALEEGDASEPAPSQAISVTPAPSTLPVARPPAESEPAQDSASSEEQAPPSLY